MQAPWTEIGRLQSDVADLKRQLYNKADIYQIHDAQTAIGNIQHKANYLEQQINDIFSRIFELEQKMQQLNESTP